MLKYLFFVFIFTFSAYANDARQVLIDYDLYAGGINGVSAKLNIKWQNNEYEFKTTTETKGFIGFLYPVTATYFTKGSVKNCSAFPQTYIATSISRSKKKVKELKYDEDGRVISRINLKKGKKTNRKVNDDMGRGNSLDYQSVLAMMLSRIDKGLDCNQSYIAFDGKRRYNMIFKDLSVSKIEKSRYSTFSGNARKCSLNIEPFNNDYPTNNWFWHRSGKHGKQMPIKFWTSKINNITVPVKIKIDSLGFGAIIAHMKSVN